MKGVFFFSLSYLYFFRVHGITSNASVFLTRTLLADDHAQVDGRPLGLRCATVGAAPVGLVEPDLLCHFIVGERLGDRFLDCFNPLLLLPLRLGSEAVTIDFFFFLPQPGPNRCLNIIDLIGRSN